MISNLLVFGMFFVGWFIGLSVETPGLVYAIFVLSAFIAGMGFYKSYKIHPGTSWWMIFFYVVGFLVGVKNVNYFWLVLAFAVTGVATFYLYYFGGSLKKASGRVTDRIENVSTEVTDRIGGVTDEVTGRIEKVSDRVKKVKDKIVK